MIVPPPRRPVVLRASRDTLLLLAAATGLTLALAYAVHTRPAPAPQAVAAANREWAGQLADIAPSSDAAASPREQLSSDALTVPKAAMALPRDPRPSKARACEGSACAARIVAVPPPRRTTAENASVVEPPRPPVVVPRRDEPSLMARMNPLNHIPDVVKRPFATAGNTVAGWVSRF